MRDFSNVPRLALTLIAAATLASSAGCGDPATPTAARADALGGTIRYDGVAAGPGRPLAIAVYRTFPPKGPPIASKLVERYEFPYAYEFSGLPPGTYYVGALIDVDRMDTRHAGMLVDKRDPHAWAEHAIELHGSAGASLVDLDLKDPQ